LRKSPFTVAVNFGVVSDSTTRTHFVYLTDEK
jgi:hypothetical protein